jgi:hypothetical protein
VPRTQVLVFKRVDAYPLFVNHGLGKEFLHRQRGTVKNFSPQTTVILSGIARPAQHMRGIAVPQSGVDRELVFDL